MSGHHRPVDVLLWAGVVLSAIIGSSPVAEAVEAQFSVVLAPHETDASLALGETLDLEIWVDLSLESGDSTIPPMLGWSVYLQLDAAEDNIISFNSDLVDEAGFTDLAFTLGTDNSSYSGEFGRGLSNFPTSTPVTLGAGNWKFASFSVTAVGDGTVTYAFGDLGGPRPWGLDFTSGNGSANVTAGAVQTILVAPEPTAAMFMLWAGGMVACTRRRVR